MKEILKENDIVWMRTLNWFDTIAIDGRISNGKFSIGRAIFERVAGQQLQVVETDINDDTFMVRTNVEIWLPTICIETQNRKFKRHKNKVRF